MRTVVSFLYCPERKTPVAQKTQLHPLSDHKMVRLALLSQNRSGWRGKSAGRAGDRCRKSLSDEWPHHFGAILSCGAAHLVRRADDAS